MSRDAVSHGEQHNHAGLSESVRCDVDAESRAADGHVEP